jgi:hypothetical protein
MPFMLACTLHARSREIAYISVRERLSIGQSINVHPCDAKHFIRLIFPERYIVFSHASHHTTAASGAFVQIDDHPKSLGFFVFH